MQQFESVDLNLNNYNLQELLALFHIHNGTISNKDLKRGKKMVMMTHPDKSKLDKKYFLFFSAAYKRLYFIYAFHEKLNDSETIEYSDIMREYYQEYSEFHSLDKKEIDTFTKSFDTKLFNELFTSNRLSNEFQDTGYSEWLKTSCSPEYDEINKSNKTTQNDLLQKYKKNHSQVVMYQDYVHHSGGQQHSTISNSAPLHYGSGVFSTQLAYEDVRKAHEESLILVTEEDGRKEIFANIDELQRYRSQPVHSLSLDESNKILHQLEENDRTEGSKRAFELAREAQKASDIQKEIRKKFNLLL